MPKEDKPKNDKNDDTPHSRKAMFESPYYVEPRRRLTQKQKLEMFVRWEGKCCICGEKINSIHDSWDEHINPLWLSGDNSAENRGPAHDYCARDKTATEASQRKNIRRKAEKNMGARTAKTRPMPGSKKSPWKKKMDGTVERRK